MPDLIIRGLPSSLANDASWLTEGPEPQNQAASAPKAQSASAPFSLLAILLLIALADFLFWRYPIGVSLVIFSAGLCAAALINLNPNFSKRDWLIFTSVWSLSALPVLEFMQITSILFLILGHASLLIWTATRSNTGPLARALMFLPFTLISFAAVTCINLGMGVGRPKPTVTQSGLVAWILPLTVGFIFLWLFIGANPVFQEWINNLSHFNISPDAFGRATFWGVIGFLVLPFAMFKGFAPHLHPKSKPQRSTVRPEGTLINARSVQNSLMLFNAMFLVQNVTDLTVLWSGSGLPEGMTYATYAHSGAYPLMATSILAGLFALISRRFTVSSDFIKMLLLIWVAQNIVLLGSAIFRLDLYVDIYGLTYLRLRVIIGMLIVLAGMALLIWQLWKSKSNAWLTGSFSAVVIFVFYTCSFVNFGYVIASENLSRDDRNPDARYLCRYVRSGTKAVLEHYSTSGTRLCFGYYKNMKNPSDNWRAWSYRSARLETYRQTYLERVNDKQPQARDSLTTKPYDTDERRQTR
jgi:hypothetical protein